MDDSTGSVDVRKTVNVEQIRKYRFWMTIQNTIAVKISNHLTLCEYRLVIILAQLVSLQKNKNQYSIYISSI